MKPLLFLTYRSFVNGVKRALSSPTRLIGLLFFVSYYFLWFIRPAMSGPGGMGKGLPPGLQGLIEFPSLQVVDSVVFGLFALLSLLMMMGGMAQQGGFKPADVDILFPTPISPRVVLGFRMIRDYVLTLLVPFFLVLVGFVPVKAGYEWVFRNMPHPENATLILRAAWLSWMLVAMCWVAINYAVSLFVNRSDRRSDLNKRLIIFATAVIVLGTATYIGLSISRMTSMKDLLGLAQSPILRTVFFTATFATSLTTAPLSNDYLSAAASAAALAGLIVAAAWIAMTQVGWMYDQAAAKGFSSASLKALQRKGDALGAAAALAQEGKGKVRKLKWLFRMNMPGPWALVWKDAFLQARGMFWMLAMIGAMGVFMILIPTFIPMKSGESIGTIFLLMQAMAIFTITISLSNMGYLEVLRRIDLQKPLPFRPAVIVFFEVGSKAILGIVVSLLGSLIAIFIRPDLLGHAVGAAIFSPSLSLLLSATTFLVIILFPDVEDQTQRQFRGVLMMLALAVIGLPPVGIFALSVVLGAPIWLASIVGAAACLAFAALTAVISGSLYANFNPSE